MEAGQLHGNLRYLYLHCSVDNQQQAEAAAAALSLGSFVGLEEVDLSFGIDDFDEELSDDTRDEITFTITTAVSYSLLWGNQSIPKLHMSGETLFRTLHSFRDFITDVILSMPNLELIDFKSNTTMDNERAQIIVNAVIASNKLQKVECLSWEGIDVGLVSEIRFHCELNRIGLPSLLADDAQMVPMGLWPLILANLRQFDLFTVLREKPDVLTYRDQATGEQRSTKRVTE